MAEFQNTVAVPGGASYVSPLLDFSPLGQLEDSYFKGTQDRQKLQTQQAFRGGIPKTPDGQNDYKAMVDKFLQLGAYPEAGTIANIGIQQQGLDMLRTNPEAGGQPAASPPAAARPSAPAAPRGAVAYDTRPARPDNDGGFQPPGGAPSTTTSGDTGPVTAPAPAAIDPRAAKAIDTQYNAPHMDYATRERNLSKLMMYAPSQAIREYAKLQLENLHKLQEPTPLEKEVDPARGNAYGRKVEMDVGGKNRELTPGAKDTASGRGGAPSVAQRQEDIKVSGANRTLTPTAKDTTPRPGESPAEAEQRIKTRGAIDTKAGEGSVANFEKDYRGLQVASQSAFNGIAKAKLGSALTQANGFYSGPLQPTSQMYQQFKATFGGDPSSAIPQEAFQKVVTDMLTEQVKALGQSGVGRVLMVEVQNMQKSIASLGITPATNRVLLDTVQRVYGQSQQLAEIARGIANDQSIPAEQKQTALDQAADNFYKQNPIFKPEEVADPRLIGAPTVPAGIGSVPAFQAWAKNQNLPSGYPVRLPNGKIKMVP